MLATMIVVLICLLIVLVPMLVFYFISLWKVFKKAGRNGWEAIIPLYNTWVLVEISGLAWWYALILILIPIVSGDGEIGVILSLGSIVVNFFVCYNISLKLHKDIGFAILMTLFPIVMFPIIAFSDKYQFDNNVIVSEHGPIKTNSSSNNNTYQSQSNDYNDFSNNQNDFNQDEFSFCSMCGNKISGNIKYCGKCGYKIK